MRTLCSYHDNVARTRIPNARRKGYAVHSAARLAVSLFITLAPAILLLSWPNSFALWWVIPVWGLQAVGVTGLSNGSHEAVHGHLFYNSFIDRQAGRLLHGMMLLNYDVHRQYHLHHHLNTGNEDDSEGVFGFENLGSKVGYARRLLRWAVPPSPLHILNWSGAVSALKGTRHGYLARVSKRQALAGFAAPVAGAASLVAWLVVNPVLALTGALIPLLCFSPVFGYFTALPEHFGLATNDFEHRTRNVLTWGPLQYLLWNFNLHAVHHRNPHLHFSLLPDGLTRVQAPTADGYLRFHADVLRELTDRKVAAEILGGRLHRIAKARNSARLASIVQAS